MHHRVLGHVGGEGFVHDPVALGLDRHHLAPPTERAQVLRELHPALYSAAAERREEVCDEEQGALARTHPTPPASAPAGARWDSHRSATRRVAPPPPCSWSRWPAR